MSSDGAAGGKTLPVGHYKLFPFGFLTSFFFLTLIEVP